MKKFVFSLIACLGALALHSAQAQDVSINITPMPATVFLNKTGIIQVVICNEDADPIAAPQNKIRPTVSFPDFLTITNVTNGDGTPLTNWSIQSLTNDPGTHSVRMLYTASLPNAECVTYNIVVTGNALANYNVITSNLGSQGPPLPGDDPNNNNSTTQMEVVVDPLPVTLVDFMVRSEGNTAILNWSTTDETNSEKFDVQRSSNGKDWKTFQTIAAKGESKALVEYSATDGNPSKGKNFYRLHIIDKDGTSAYSRIRNVKFEGEAITMYPNPVSEELQIKGIDFNKVSRLKILNASGVEVYNESGSQADRISVKKLPEGIYIVRIMASNGEESTHKIVVKK